MRRATTTFLTLLTLAAAPTPLQAAEADHAIEAEDYFSLAYVADLAVSPDGERVVYAERRWDEAANARKTELWLVGTRRSEPRRLTFDGDSKGSVAWSRDGESVYHLSDRERAGEDGPPWDGSTQVWRLPVGGGEPVPVTRVPDGVGRFALSDDGRALFYTRAKEQVDDAWKDLREEFRSIEYGHGIVDTHEVWRLDLRTWREERVADTGRVVTDLAVSPDGQRVALITKPDETLLSGEGWSRVDVWDPASGEMEIVTAEGWRKDHPSPHGWLKGLAWSRDGEALAFTVDFDGYPAEILVVEWDGDAHALRELERPSDVHVVSGWLAWRGDDRDLLFRGEAKARRRLYAFPDVEDGDQDPLRTVSKGDVVVDAVDLDREGDVVVAALSTPDATQDLYVVDGRDRERLTDVNPQTRDWRWPQMSVVEWEGEGGAPVEGILELPPGHEPGTPLPMVVIIHGGPSSAANYRRRFWIYGRTLLAAKGYATLSPNYRGSTGYGDAFMTDLVGRENDVEVADILKGVDAMVERGIADPERLAVMGWSNGGYLTNCVITKTDRFKAASSGAGVLHQVMQWGLEDTPGHVINFMEGLPWERTEAYREGSPLYDLEEVSTPTLIHVGEHDERVPVAHARALHRALHVYLGVPSELLVYPGEGHGLRKYDHRKAKMAWDLAWFEKYLDPGSTPRTSTEEGAGN
ncbi:MAG: prolyl oligopeptidase family serine peptidase [Myxococcota bacterium]